MNASPTYAVLLLPRRELAARHLSLAEALAWMRGYNAIFPAGEREAVLTEERVRRPGGQPAAA